MELSGCKAEDDELLSFKGLLFFGEEVTDEATWWTPCWTKFDDDSPLPLLFILLFKLFAFLTELGSFFCELNVLRRFLLENTFGFEVSKGSRLGEAMVSSTGPRGDDI